MNKTTEKQTVARGYTFLRHVKSEEEGKQIIQVIVKKSREFNARNLEIKEGCVQLEQSTGVEGGRQTQGKYHVQGYIIFSNSVRPSFINKLFEEKFNCVPVNIKLLNQSKKSGNFYFEKADTRIGNNYDLSEGKVTFDQLPKSLQFKDTRFEKDLWDKIDSLPARRQFLVVVNESYGLGKTTWALKNMFLNKVVYIPIANNNKEICEFIAHIYKDKGRVLGGRRIIEEELIFVIDLPGEKAFTHKFTNEKKGIVKGAPSKEWEELLTLGEMIANGLITDKRYGSTIIYFDSPKVVFFTNNNLPKKEYWGVSRDRVKEWRPNHILYDDFKVKEHKQGKLEDILRDK